MQFIQRESILFCTNCLYFSPRNYLWEMVPQWRTLPNRMKTVRSHPLRRYLQVICTIFLKNFSMYAFCRSFKVRGTSSCLENSQSCDSADLFDIVEDGSEKACIMIRFPDGRKVKRNIPSNNKFGVIWTIYGKEFLT